MSYRVKLNVFEGPFDLLVYLIEHARMNIYDIRISEITTQYIDYIDRMKEADITVSADFMVLAASLLEIKSKMLLPRLAPAGDGVTELAEDPRTELVEKLLEYKKYKAISAMLEERRDDTARSIAKPQEDLSEYTGEPDVYLTLDLDRFKSAFEDFLLRKKRIDEIREHHRRTEKQRLTTELRIEDIKAFFRETGMEERDFRELVRKKDDRYDIAVTFSSLLEMIKENRLSARQKRLFGDILVKPTDKLFAPKSGEAEGVQEQMDTPERSGM
ncbi:MAG: segregation/condensation protein A [Firmicutes bacterium]|nr:segregation/condensation protein A [Bacillota bacterium]